MVASVSQTAPSPYKVIHHHSTNHYLYPDLLILDLLLRNEGHNRPPYNLLEVLALVWALVLALAWARVLSDQMGVGLVWDVVTGHKDRMRWHLLGWNFAVGLNRCH